MPRTKICGDVYLYKDIATALEKSRKYCEYTSDEFAAMLRMTRSTWERRKKKPEDLTIEELWRAINALKMPYDEAVALLTAGIKNKPTKKASRNLDAATFWGEFERRFALRDKDAPENT